MAAEFILIPGRSSRQGVTLNEGKYTDGYLDETSTLRMHPEDMRSIGVAQGDEVRMWNDVGEVVVPCIDAKDECPQGIIFICYGDKSSQLMGGETHGSGMPDSKGLDVFVQSATQPRPATQTASAATRTPALEPPQPGRTPTPSAVKPVASSKASSPSTPASSTQLGPTLVMGLFVLTLVALAVVMYLAN